MTLFCLELWGLGPPIYKLYSLKVHQWTASTYQIMPANPPTAAFRYLPLPGRDWIRLVVVRSDLSGGDIDCTLHLFDAKSCPEYIALSYLWGDPAPRHTININGLARRIHENLWTFLNQAWQNQATDYFWIDSLCLDQASHSELNEQVQRMGDIYYQAHHVISWLGEGFQRANALRTVARFSQVDMQLDEAFEAWSSGPFRPSELVYPSKALQLEEALKTLILRETYWGRVWIFQEVICAKECTVVCGPVEMPFEYLVDFVRRASDKAYFTLETQASFESHWIFKLTRLRADLMNSRHLGFGSVVMMLSDCASTRKVDRIYGLLGLAGRFDPEFDLQVLEVDYDKSLDEVFWDVACLLSGTLDPVEYLKFLNYMPIIKAQTNPFVETATIVGPHLKGYSIGPATPDKWRCQTRVAHKIYQAIASACLHTNYDGPTTCGLSAAWICYAWTSMVKSVIDDVFRVHHRESSRSWLDPRLTDIGENMVTERRFSRTEGIILGLSLVVCTWSRDPYYKVMSVPSPGPLRWFCATHMPRHATARQVEAIPLTFRRHFALADLGLICAAHSNACEYSNISVEIEDEDLVFEVRSSKFEA